MKQQQKGAANQDIISLQKQQDAAAREAKRKLKAATRAATPSRLGSSSELNSLSRRSSMLQLDSASSAITQSQQESATASSININEQVGEPSTPASSLTTQSQRQRNDENESQENRFLSFGEAELPSEETEDE